MSDRVDGNSSHLSAGPNIIILIGCFCLSSYSIITCRQAPIALAAVGAVTVVVTAVLVKLRSLVFPMRVSEEAESAGLDIPAHGERAYDLAS
jgi:ammonia channel protein AmtB